MACPGTSSRKPGKRNAFSVTAPFSVAGAVGMVGDPMPRISLDARIVAIRVFGASDDGKRSTTKACTIASGWHNWQASPSLQFAAIGANSGEMIVDVLQGRE